MKIEIVRHITGFGLRCNEPEVNKLMKIPPWSRVALGGYFIDLRWRHDYKMLPVKLTDEYTLRNVRDVRINWDGVLRAAVSEKSSLLKHDDQNQYCWQLSEAIGLFDQMVQYWESVPIDTMIGSIEERIYHHRLSSLTIKEIWNGK